MKKVGLYRIPALGIDLIIAGVMYYITIIMLYVGKPTAAELGYGIYSAQVTQEQITMVLLGAGVWLGYSILFTLILKHSVGQKLVGITYSTDTTLFTRIISVILSPLLIVDSLFRVKIHLKEHNSISRISTAVGLLLSLGAIPGFLLYVVVAGFIILMPIDNNNNDFSLCGEKFCLVSPNTACEKDINLARERTVEIVGQEKSGTGMLISDSLVLTNFHVVENEPTLQIREQNGRTSNAVIYTSNPDLDIAVLIGQFTKGEHVQFVDPKLFSEGSDLYAIGYPGSALRETGGGSISVTKGIYSSFLDFPYYNVQLVQTDTPVNPGNSGGPLVNNCGQIFGMVTLSEKFDPITQTIKEGLNFAISSTTLVPELNRLTK